MMKDWSSNTGFGSAKARQLYADTHPASASPKEARQMTIHPSSCRCPRPAASALPTASTDCTARRTGSASWSDRGRTRWRGHEFWSGNPRWPAHCSRTRRRGWFSANSKRPTEKKMEKRPKIRVRNSSVVLEKSSLPILKRPEQPSSSWRLRWDSAKILFPARQNYRLVPRTRRRGCLISRFYAPDKISYKRHGKMSN